jgi:putative transposase
MPRCARVKSYDAIYHTMVRSISEVNLFKSDEDKAAYLDFMKKYQKLYKFRVYAYCLMDNHAHFIIDANGADISKIMHSINFSYAQYFNKKYDRHGHLFQDRFKSKIVENEKYMFALSAYIHNNPTDIKSFENCPEKYYFSSLEIYLGIRRDPFELIEDGFILSLFGNNKKTARENYLNFVLKCRKIIKMKELEFENEATEYRSYRKLLVRNFNVDDVIKFIVEKMDVQKIKLHMKYCKEIVEAKALLVLLLRSLCNLKCSEICRILGNITQSRVSSLSSMGIKLIDSENRYRELVQEFIQCYS